MESIYKTRDNKLVKITPVPANEETYTLDQIQLMIDRCDQQIANSTTQRAEYVDLLTRAQGFELKTDSEYREDLKKEEDLKEQDRKDELKRLSVQPTI